MKGSRFFFAIVLTALTLAAPAGAQQSTPWYEIELIVFRQPDPTGLDAELHPVDPPPPEAEQVVTLRQLQGGATLPYAMLDSGELQLGAVYQRLQDSGRYQPLLHIGWRQPGLSSAEAASVAIPPEWQPWGNALRPPLHGLIRFQQDRFLHFAVDLRYRPEPAFDAVSFSEGTLDVEPQPTYVHQQSRRVRTGELHYLDHPALGVLVQVRRLTDG